MLSLIVISAQSATIIYSTDGTSTPGFATASGFSVFGPSSNAIAMRFLASRSGTLSGVILPLSANVPGPSSETFEALTDVGGAPGIVLDTITFTDVTGLGLYTANSLLHPILTAGTPYWLEATPPNGLVLIAWYSARPSVNGTVWASSVGLETNQQLPAFALLGSDIPEPVTAGLFVMGVLVLLCASMISKSRRWTGY